MAYMYDIRNVEGTGRGFRQADVPGSFAPTLAIPS